MERAFGLLVGRWGVFWKKLSCKPARYKLVIQAAVRLHNIAQGYACDWTAREEAQARRRAASYARTEGEEDDAGTQVDTSASDEVRRPRYGAACPSGAGSGRYDLGRTSHHATVVPSRQRRAQIAAALARAGLARPAPRAESTTGE